MNRPRRSGDRGRGAGGAGAVAGAWAAIDAVVDRLEARRLLSAVALGPLNLTEGPNYVNGRPSAASVNDTVYFGVYKGIGATELWKTQGHEAVLVKSFRLFESSGPAAPPPLAHFTAVGGAVFFTADGGLWKTDGTAAGTTELASIGFGSEYYNYFDPQMTGVGDKLFFRAPAQAGLWTSDGTPQGTRQVKSGSVSGLMAVGDVVYFSSGGALWRSDGTFSGTVKVFERAPFGNIAAIGNAIYFLGSDNRLYKSDGTTAGTQVAANINPASSLPVHLTVAGDLLYFPAQGTTGVELWRSDGTAEGTRLLKDIDPQTTSSPSNLVGVGGRLFFTASDGVHGSELWTSDGTEEGTRLVKDIEAGSARSAIAHLTAVGDTVYFSGGTSAGGQELWRSDGTEQGVGERLFRRHVESGH